MKNRIYVEPPDSERKYRRLAMLGVELGVPVPEMFLELEVTMPDGKVVHHHKQRGHSWVRNAYNLILSEIAGQPVALGGGYGAGSLCGRDTGGTVRSHATFAAAQAGTQDMTGTTWGYRAPAATATKSIQVGTGAGAESFESHQLGTQVAEGAGAGQLNHVQTEAHDFTYNAGTRTWTLNTVRYFNNNSGGDIGINEVALVCRYYFGGNDNTYMNARDLLGAVVTVPDTGQLKVTYTIQMTYPA